MENVGQKICRALKGPGFNSNRFGNAQQLLLFACSFRLVAGRSFFGALNVMYLANSRYRARNVCILTALMNVVTFLGIL